MGIYFILLTRIDSPASLTRIDPEYLCLLNGLNVSIFRFDNIGYTDLPGTPFLVLTGIFIRIIHLFCGKGSILDDVILRPDYYLQGASYLLILVTILAFIWGGIKIYRATGNWFALIVLQASFLLSPVTLSLQVRYNADRFLPLLVFVFAVYTLLYLVQSINSRKYALCSGIILGIGCITKFNFIALTILPVFLFVSFKDWLIYGVSFMGSSFLSFLPIIGKFQNVKRFITGLAQNQGPYGQGGKQMFNLEAMFHNLKEITALNEGFTILIILTVITLVLFLFRRKTREDRKKVWFLFGFLVASAIEIIMVSKHFKNYYLVPVLGFSGLVFYILWDCSFRRKKISGIGVGGMVLLLFIALSITKMTEHTKITRSKKEARIKTVTRYKEIIQPSDYLLFEPAWISGPSHINGLLFGISYVADKNDFTETYLKQYPNVLTYEGDDRPIKHFRTIDADIGQIFREGNRVYLFSTPGRNTHRVIKELERQAKKVNSRVITNTVFVNDANHDKIIKATFRQIDDSIAYTTTATLNDMEKEYPNWKQNALTEEWAYSGSKSSKIQKGDKSSPVYRNDSLPQIAENLNSIVVSCMYFQPGTKNNTRLIVELINPDEERFWYPVFCIDYFKEVDNWAGFNYKMYVPKKFRTAEKLNVYFYNASKEAVYIDDFEVEIYYKTPLAG